MSAITGLPCLYVCKSLFQKLSYLILYGCSKTVLPSCPYVSKNYPIPNLVLGLQMLFPRLSYFVWAKIVLSFVFMSANVVKRLFYLVYM